MEEIIEQMKIFDFDPRDLKDSEEEIIAKLHKNNSQVIDRQMNFRCRKGFESSIEAYKKEHFGN